MLSLRSVASDERKPSAPVWNGSRLLFSLSCCLWWGRHWLPVTAEVPTFMSLMLCNKFTPAGNQPETWKVRVWWKLWTADRGLFILQVFVAVISPVIHHLCSSFFKASGFDLTKWCENVLRFAGILIPEYPGGLDLLSGSCVFPNTAKLQEWEEG